MVHLMMENQEDLAGIMTIEQGKPLAESRGEVVYGATRTSDLAVSADAHFAQQIKRLIGCTPPGVISDTFKMRIFAHPHALRNP